MRSLRGTQSGRPAALSLLPLAIRAVARAGFEMREAAKVAAASALESTGAVTKVASNNSNTQQQHNSFRIRVYLRAAADLYGI